MEVSEFSYLPQLNCVIPIKEDLKAFETARVTFNDEESRVVYIAGLFDRGEEDAVEGDRYFIIVSTGANKTGNLEYKVTSREGPEKKPVKVFDTISVNAITNYHIMRRL